MYKNFPKKFLVYRTYLPYIFIECKYVNILFIYNVYTIIDYNKGILNLISSL